jgi:arylsulfatase
VFARQKELAIPDNGASSEGGVNGAFNEMSSFNY